MSLSARDANGGGLGGLNFARSYSLLLVIDIRAVKGSNSVFVFFEPLDENSAVEALTHFGCQLRMRNIRYKLINRCGL